MSIFKNSYIFFFRNSRKGNKAVAQALDPRLWVCPT